MKFIARKPFLSARRRKMGFPRPIFDPRKPETWNFEKFLLSQSLLQENMKIQNDLQLRVCFMICEDTLP